MPFEGVLVEAYKGTRRKHNLKFRQIGHTTSQYGQSFFPKTISAWNGLAFAEAPSLAVFRSHFIKNTETETEKHQFFPACTLKRADQVLIVCLCMTGEIFLGAVWWLFFALSLCCLDVSSFSLNFITTL